MLPRAAIEAMSSEELAARVHHLEIENERLQEVVMYSQLGGEAEARHALLAPADSCRRPGTVCRRSWRANFAFAGL